ncbi:MAG: hypothetical protein HY921_00140 [Elusimicrobia bacterium]|nr:hypothetical protein [Elusimicrobiota bacterium]
MTRPLNIALVSYHFYNHTAAGLSTSQLAKALADRGHKITAFASPHPLLSDPAIFAAEGPLAGVAASPVAPAGPGPWMARVRELSRQDSLLGRLACIPNLVRGCNWEEWDWVLSASRGVRQAHRERPFDLVLTRLNHYISHLAGLEIRRALPGLAWCAYFSDPWPHHLYPTPYHFKVGPLSRLRSERLLEEMLSQAGSYVFPSERLKNYLLKGDRAKYLSKAFVAPHLASLWKPAPPPPARRTLVLRHAGFLMKERRIEPLCAGLRLFLARRPRAREELRVEFAGRYEGNDLPAPPADLASVIGFHPHLPPDSVWRWLQEADVFLLVEAKMEEGVFFSSKLADYLSGGRPIFALSPRRGVTADILGSGGGVLAEPDDAEGISRALERVHGLWKEGRLGELSPSREQRESVSPARVMPIYEDAFAAAIHA